MADPRVFRLPVHHRRRRGRDGTRGKSRGSPAAGHHVRIAGARPVGDRDAVFRRGDHLLGERRAFRAHGQYPLRRGRDPRRRAIDRWPRW